MQDSLKPIFIIGNPRSGTSLFRLMVSSHPDIVVPPESGFMQWWHTKYKNWSVSDNNSKDTVQGFIDDLKSSTKIETWKLDYDQLSNLIAENKPDSYASLCALVYNSYAKQIGKSNITRWGDKNNYYINHLEQLLSIYPQAQFLFIVRDGRDVACSYRAIKDLKTDSVYKPKLPFDIGKIAEEWRGNHLRILAFVGKLKEDQHHFLRYEDLVSSPKETLQKVAEFIDVPYSDEMLSYHSENERKGMEPAETLDWKKKTLQPPDASQNGKYKEILSAGDIKIFNEKASEVLNRFSYEIEPVNS